MTTLTPHVPEEPAAETALPDAPCDMFTQDPYDFAWCETHDETFPLGGICPFHPKAPRDATTEVAAS